MRIEPAFSPPQTTPTASTSRWAGLSTASTIISPHAPLWGGRIFSFFRWIFSFFTWCLPAKKEKPTPINPPEEFALAVKKAKEAEISNRNPIPGLILGLAVQRIFFYTFGAIEFGVKFSIQRGVYWALNWPFTEPVYNGHSSELYSSVSIQTTRHCVDKVANYFFPNISQLRKRVGSLAISNTIIYMGMKHFGYEFNWINVLFQVREIQQLYERSRSEEQQKRQARLFQAVAN